MYYRKELRCLSLFVNIIYHKSPPKGALQKKFVKFLVDFVNVLKELHKDSYRFYF